MQTSKEAVERIKNDGMSFTIQFDATGPQTVAIAEQFALWCKENNKDKSWENFGEFVKQAVLEFYDMQVVADKISKAGE